MARGKLILICQSGGTFVTKDDGSMSYSGGEAQALDISPESLFDDLKFKIAEMWNLEYGSLSVKYFIPGNKQTLITLSNDNDLTKMFEVHEGSVTADLFVSGTEGFDRKALDMHASRAGGIKRAETVSPAPASRAATNRRSRKVAKTSKSSSVYTDSDSDSDSDSDESDDPDETGYSSPDIIDMSSTPADTVKKRRRTAAKTRKSTQKGKRKNVVSRRKKSGRSQILINSSDIPSEMLVASWKDGITGEGQEFESVKEFRDALQKYAIAHRFAYKLKKNDTNRASAVCTAEDCSWHIHASWVPSENIFKIKKMDKSHTCSYGGESWKSTPNKNWLVNIIKDRLRDSPHHRPKDIANGILRDFGLELSYSQVWRGLEDAREQLQGSYKEAYDQLPWFCEKLLEANPGSFAKLLTGDDKRFQRLFVSFHASIQGFQNGCRPLIFLDSTSLKSKYQEMLLTATSVDGDDGAFPLAFAVVDNENDDNWHWFLEQLKSAVATSQSITFVSDREKGLKKSVLEVFENAFHGYSIYHLVEDLKKNLKFQGEGKTSFPVSFLAAAQAVRLDGLKMFTEQVKKASSHAYNWFMQIEPEYWTNAAFKGEPYSQITENVGESYINWIAEVRELPIIQKVEALRCKMMELINTRRADSSKWSTRLTPSKEKKLQEESAKAHGLKVLISSDTLFEVHDNSIHVVNIEKWDCSCRGWKTTGLPCHHAVAVFNRARRNAYDYAPKYFTADMYRITYSESISPVLALFTPSVKEEDDAEAEHVLPPCPSRPPTQQKEKPVKTKEAARKVVTCTRCKGEGHYRVTCKAEL